MRKAGYFFVVVGFLAGSFTVVMQPEGVPVVQYLAALSVSVFGIVLIRRAMHGEATDEVLISANIQTLESALRRIVDNAAQFAATKDEFNVYDLRYYIDRTFRVDLMEFADARESIAHSFGLQAYSEVLSRFAAGERYMNRVWSASTDGYFDEAHTYIDRSAEQFRDALDTFVMIKAK